MCDYFDSGVFGKARRVPVQPPSVSDCDNGDADCTINEIRGELSVSAIAVVFQILYLVCSIGS